MPGLCPTPERLAAALRGRQPGGADAELAAHLSNCPACQAQLEALAGGSGWLEAKARIHAATAPTASEPLRQAIRALESRTGNSERETAPPPKLDFLQPSDQPGVLGRFGPYEVIAHVASGGMGIVLKARDPALDRVVALKILPPALAANALARARFVREARAAAAVVHEHVVPIYAVDECAGLPYLVMQFVQGCTLAERIRATGPLRLEEVLRIGAQTAAGLAAAHAQGLIHRDVKPGNILLENSVERVKLTDFGLARAVDDAGLTRTGELAGTPEFMSPEQAGNEAVDHRSDLFSFGSVLYAMCTGCSPFQASSVIAVVRKVCDEQPPPVHEINPSIPRWLSDIVARLMAKSPVERFQSAREVGELLERYLARVQHGELGALPDHWVQPEATRWRWSLSYAIGAVALLTVVGLLIFALKDRRAPSSNAGSQAASQTAFVVCNEEGKILGSYAEVTEAVRAAPPAGVVELRWNGPRKMPPVTLGVKPLTLRAAKGFRPGWVHTKVSESALTAGAALTLEGLEFMLDLGEVPFRGSDAGGPAPGRRSGGAPGRPQGGRVDASGVGLISISNAPLRLLRCAIQLGNPRSGSRLAFVPVAQLAAIKLENSTTCELMDTALLALPGKAILWRHRSPDPSKRTAGSTRDDPSLSLTNCVVSAAQAFWMDLAEDSLTRLQLVRCTFKGPNAFYFPEGNAGWSVTVMARNNLFVTGTILRDDRRTSRASLTAAMRWQGDENLFSPGRGGYVALAAGAGDPPPTTLAEWNRWWGQTEPGSRQVTVKFADGANETISGTGGTFGIGRMARSSPTAFKVTEVHLVEGPALSEADKARFGADTARVGPASPE